MAKLEYPYQNLSLVNIKGERWKDIPNLVGYFMVSNMGRIKRLEYEMTYKNGAIYTKEERIIKLQKGRATNKLKNDILEYLTTLITFNKVKYSFTLSRLVYYSFVEEFDLKDKAILILNKDCDGLNVLPTNLIKSTHSDKAKRIVARGRMDSTLKYFSEEERKKQRQAIVTSLSKEVTQYSLKGKKIRTYPSCAAAERATNIFASVIGNRAGGRGLSAGGYVWRWGKEKMVDVETVKKERREKHIEEYGQKVTQYDFDGNKIATFCSLQEAELATTVNANAIRLVIKGKYKSAKGFFWKKGFGKDKIDLSQYKWGRQSMAVTQSKKVNQLALDGVFIKTYSSLKEAAAEVQVKASTIVDACKGRQKTARGYRWEYA
jgi:hypothetical protein